MPAASLPPPLKGWNTLDPLASMPGNVDDRAWDFAFGDMLFFPGNVTEMLLTQARAHVLSKL